jgi:hypothetical protein
MCSDIGEPGTYRLQPFVFPKLLLPGTLWGVIVHRFLFLGRKLLYIRAQRWRVLLRPVGTPFLRALVDATNIGFMANVLLPLRIGEIIRPVLLSRKERQPLGGILATIVLERIFDMFTILFLDRDGVLNRAIIRGGKPYPPATLAALEILPGVAEALQELAAAGFLLIGVTNQPDVA